MKPSIHYVSLKFFALALSFISCISNANGRSETYLPAPSFINCFERGDLEKALDKMSSKEVPKFAKQLHKEGLCMISPEY